MVSDTSKTARNAFLKDLFRTTNSNREDASAHHRVLGIDMSVNIVRAVMTSPNSISQFFAEPKQPLPEIVDKVIESIQPLIDHKFHVVCMFDGLAPLMKVEGANGNRYGSHVKYRDNLEQMYQKA